MKYFYLKSVIHRLTKYYSLLMKYPFLPCIKYLFFYLYQNSTKINSRISIAIGTIHCEKFFTQKIKLQSTQQNYLIDQFLQYLRGRNQQQIRMNAMMFLRENLKPKAQVVLQCFQKMCTSYQNSCILCLFSITESLCQRLNTLQGVSVIYSEILVEDG